MLKKLWVYGYNQTCANDHQSTTTTPKSRLSNFSTESTSEQQLPVNYDQRPPKTGLKI